MTSVSRENYVYIRESKEEAIRPGNLGNYSVPRMIADCLQLAAEHGVVVPPQNVVVEDAKRNEWDAPKLNAILDRAEDGQVGYLISWDATRLTGDLARSLYVRATLGKAGVTKLFVHGHYDETDEGDAMESFQAIMDGMERKKIRRRTQNGIRGKLESQQPVGGGRTPYGLVKVRNERGRPTAYVADETTAPIVNRMLAALASQSFGEIAAELNAEAVPTPSGEGRWHPASVRNIVNNSTIRGVYRYGVRQFTPARHADGRRKYLRALHPDEHVVAFAIPPVVDLQLAARADAGVASRKVTRRSRLSEDEDPYVLRGAARCGLCGSPLSCVAQGPTGARRRYYLCPKAFPRDAEAKASPSRCTLPVVPAVDLERHAWDLLTERLHDHNALEDALRLACDGGQQKARHDDQFRSVRDEMAKLERAIDNGIAAMREAGPESRTFKRIAEANRLDEAKLDELSERLDELQAAAPVVLGRDEAEAIREMWRDLEAGIEVAAEDAPLQRQVVAALKFTVSVQPASEGGVRLGRLKQWLVEPAAVVAGAALAVCGGVVISQGIATPPHTQIALWSGPAGAVLVGVSAA